LGKVKILVAISPPALLRVVDHLLYGRSEFEVVARSSEQRGLCRQAARHLPDVVITNPKVLGREPAKVVTEFKRSSPASKLVLLGENESSGDARRFGADGYVSEDAVVRRLIATVRNVSHGPAASRPNRALIASVKRPA
jgi:DNA-binding NarL/FixJ family response regulator